MPDQISVTGVSPALYGTMHHIPALYGTMHHIPALYGPCGDPTVSPTLLTSVMSHCLHCTT